jgi:hypothetical protein
LGKTTGFANKYQSNGHFDGVPSYFFFFFFFFFFFGGDRGSSAGPCAVAKSGLSYWIGSEHAGSGLAPCCCNREYSDMRAGAQRQYRR